MVEYGEFERGVFIDKFVAAARECLDTPFLHQGRTLGRGMDCAGVLIYALEKMGIPYEAPKAYPRHPYQGMMQAILDSQSHLERVLREGRIPLKGDILLMRFLREPQHLAICTGETIVHSYADAGKVVEHTLTPEWRRRIIEIYQVLQ